MDHCYTKLGTSQDTSRERMPTIFGIDHMYTKRSNSTPSKTPTPTHSKKRERSSPTGVTPHKPSKIGQKRNILWTETEKEFFKQYVQQTPRGRCTLTEYWQKCAQTINTKFPSTTRNGLSCKALSQRLFVSPLTDYPTSSMDRLDDMDIADGFQMLSTGAEKCDTHDVETQTTLSLPVKTDRGDVKDGDWVFMEPRKVLQPGSSVGAEYLHQSAKKRLRQYQCLSNAEKASLIDILCDGTPRQIARALMSSTLGEEIKALFIFDIEMEARECNSKSSVLNHKGYEDLKEFQWSDILYEMLNRQSILAEVLLAVALPTGKIGDAKSTEALCPVIATVYGMLMMKRSKQLSSVQKFITATLANEQTHQKVYDRLQKVGVSLSHNGMLQLMSGISGSFNSELIDSVKDGKKFRIVGDNVNFHVGVAHERKSVGKSGHMEHWFGSAAIIQNVDYSALSEIAPQCDLRQVPYETFLLSQTGLAEEVYHMSYLAAQILTEHFPWLQFAKAAMNEEHENQPSMNAKSKVIPLPILHKNEQKYADVIDILDSYLCESTFEAAEIPSQKVHIGGDQLTRERFSGARRLRAAAFTETERLEGLHPVTFELFHLQMTVLSAFYQILYSHQNTEPFTLYSQKVRLLRKEADGNDVKNHYDTCKDLAESVIKAYVVEAACEHIGLPNTDIVPENIPDSSQMTSEEIRSWLIDQVSPIILKVTQSTRKALNGTFIQKENEDPVYSYGNILIELGLMYMELCNIIKKPNRDRMLHILKYLMIMLKGHNNRSKYALEILRLLCHQYALLSEKTAHESFYGLFVNTGKTIIPADLQMEYLVRLTKGHLRSMCSNATEKSLVKRSSSFFGLKEISDHFDKETGTIKRAQKHKRLSSYEDEKKIISSLRAIRPFLETPGRQVVSMKKAPKNPITKLTLEEFIKWIENHKVNLFYEL